MTVETASSFSNFPQEIETGLQDYRKIYQTKIPDRINFPVYGLPDNKFLILDGNHRATELFRAFKNDAKLIWNPVTLLVIRGPICQTILLDLKHWQN